MFDSMGGENVEVEVTGHANAHVVIDLTEDDKNQDKQDVNDKFAVGTATEDVDQNETQRHET